MAKAKRQIVVRKDKRGTPINDLAYTKDLAMLEDRIIELEKTIQQLAKNTPA